MRRGPGYKWLYFGGKKQFNEPRIYQDVNDNENILPKLSEVNNKMFSSLRMKGFIKEKQLKYFTCKYKKAANIGKLYLLPKFHKRLFDVPVKLVISNSGTPTEKCFVFLDHHLKNVMQKWWSYIKDPRDFIKKMNNLVLIPENVILETIVIVGLYPSIPHEVKLGALREALDKRDAKKVIGNSRVCI